MRRRSDLRRYRRYLAQEFDNVVLYRRLAGQAKGEHREVLLELAAADERHACLWQEKLAEHGETPAVAGDHRPRTVTRLLTWLGRRLGIAIIVPLLERVEAAERAATAANRTSASGSHPPTAAPLRRPSVGCGCPGRRRDVPGGPGPSASPWAEAPGAEAFSFQPVRPNMASRRLCSSPLPADGGRGPMTPAPR